MYIGDQNSAILKIPVVNLKCDFAVNHNVRRHITVGLDSDGLQRRTASFPGAVSMSAQLISPPSCIPLDTYCATTSLVSPSTRMFPKSSHTARGQRLEMLPMSCLTNSTVLPTWPHLPFSPNTSSGTRDPRPPAPRPPAGSPAPGARPPRRPAARTCRWSSA